MNTIGIHALVWSGSWGAKECEYAVASSKEAGYDIIELPVFQPGRHGHRGHPAGARRQRHGGDLLAGAVASTRTSTARTPTAWPAARRLLHEALVTARDLGSPYFGGVIFSALGPYTVMPTERSRQQLRRRHPPPRREGRRPWASRSGWSSSTATSPTSSTRRRRRSSTSRRSGMPNVVVHARLVPHEHRGERLPHSRSWPPATSSATSTSARTTAATWARARRLPAALRGPRRGRLRRCHHLRVLLVGSRR